MYFGDYNFDQKHGFGVYKWADGRVYVGQWAFGKYDSTRIYILPNGEVKKAQWDGETKGAYIPMDKEEIDRVNAAKNEAIKIAN